MRARGRVGAALGAAVLLMTLSCVAWVLVDGFRYLSTGEPPRKADLMVVLSGGSGERFATALELWRAEAAPRILVTDGHGYPDDAFSLLRDRGVPVRALLAPPRPSRSTYEDALAIRQVLEKGEFKSILVVTSPYHCRRTGLILGRVLSRIRVGVTITSSVSLYMSPERWWRSRQGWITVGPEFPKLVWAWLTVPVGAEIGDGGSSD